MEIRYSKTAGQAGVLPPLHYQECVFPVVLKCQTHTSVTTHIGLGKIIALCQRTSAPRVNQSNNFQLPPLSLKATALSVF